MINSQFFNVETDRHRYRIMQSVLPNDAQYGYAPQMTNPKETPGEPNLAYYTLPFYYVGDPENDMRIMWMKEMADLTFASAEAGSGPLWCVENNNYVYPVWSVNELDHFQGIFRVNAYVIQGLLYLASS